MTHILILLLALLKPEPAETYWITQDCYIMHTHEATFNDDEHVYLNCKDVAVPAIERPSPPAMGPCCSNCDNLPHCSPALLRQWDDFEKESKFTCADKRRVLLTQENGDKICVKF